MWITVEFDRAAWSVRDGTALSLVFRGDDGAEVKLPAGPDAFAVQLQQG